MAISIDWESKIIYVPKDYMTLVQTVPSEIRDLSLNQFRLDLKALEAGVNAGMPYIRTNIHNTEVNLGGIVYARVIQIINGYTITFEDGAYSVNLLGANSNVGDVINLNAVSVRSANSAGLISNAAIEFSSFNGGVTIDQNNITGRAKVGTIFPAGTDQQPCLTLDDANLIATHRGFNKIWVKGNLDITDDTNSWISFEFVGESPIKSLIYVDEISDVFNCEFYDATINGILDGSSQIEKSIVNNIDFVDGFIYGCSLGPSIIKLGTTTSANFFSCYSTVPGEETPTIDLNETGILALRDYYGGALLTNYSGSGSHSIDLSSGQIKLDTTITSGTFVVRGIGKLIDTSGNPIPSGTWNGGVTIINELLTAGDAGTGGGSTWSDSEKKQIRDAIGVDGCKSIAKGGQLQKKSESPYNDIIDTTNI